MAGIYIHIPFCEGKCNYCDFYSVARCGSIPGFVDALKLEMTRRSGYLPGSAVDTVYFGGGTPSQLPLRYIGSILDGLRERFDLSSVTEVTFEANPEDLNTDYLAGLFSLGINRLSLGVQSLDDEILKMLNRRHDSARVYAVMEQARRAGFQNISLDMIYGIPGLDNGSWRKALGRVVELAPEHISAYHLTIEEGTKFGRMFSQGRMTPVDDKISERHYGTLNAILSEAGYRHYEISNFSRPDFRSLHNSSYWTGEPYLGLGPGAHSFDGSSRTFAAGDLDRYLLDSPDIYTTERLTQADKYNEYVMLGLRTSDGIDASTVRLRWPDWAREFTETACRSTGEGLLAEDKGNYRIPEDKWLVSDHIIGRFFR